MYHQELKLRKFVAPECVIGSEARRLVVNFAMNLGAQKVLIVTDPGVRAAGWASNVIDDVTNAGLPYVIFDDVTPNPRAEEVMSGSEVYLKNGCNCIIAVGGGSPMDCAKGIGIVSTNKRNILEFEGIDEVRVPIPPLICVPTTGGSSADVSQFAIITDRENELKIVIGSKTIVPDVSLLDPDTLTTMPRSLAANTGMDVLAHAFEAYVSPVQSAITDLLALEAVRLISRYLCASIEDPLNIELKYKICLACLDAGFSFSNASLGLVHAMAHSLGGLLDVPHAECNAIMMPYVISFNFPVAGERYRDLAEAMGVDSIRKMNSKEVETALIDAIIRLHESLGVPVSLSGFGIRRSSIKTLAMKAINDPLVATNPREPSLEDIETIYEQAL